MSNSVLETNASTTVTDRARKLRGQYALQAQGLRVRLEGRLNRVPFQLRQRKMQDLMNEYVEKRSPAKPALMSTQARKVVEVPMPRKELKRQRYTHQTPRTNMMTADNNIQRPNLHRLRRQRKRYRSRPREPQETRQTHRNKSQSSSNYSAI